MYSCEDAAARLSLKAALTDGSAIIHVLLMDCVMTAILQNWG
jgi:hypothetical protein